MRKVLSGIFMLLIVGMLVSCGDDATTAAGSGSNNSGSTSTECTDTSSTSSLPSCVRTDMSYE